MKKFYLLFLTLPVLAAALLYLNIWWFIAGVILLMAFIAFQIYLVKLKAAVSRVEVLENEVDDLNARLETAVVKEQKTMKEVNQVREMKQQLLSALSHEIRTPMNGVMGMSLLLTDTQLTAEQQEYVTTIRQCSEGLLTTVNSLLVNDMLDFSKLQQEGKQLEYKNFELRNAVEEVMELFTGKVKPTVDLVYDIDPNVPQQIIGDNKRLRQVMINLVENAVKFTNQGEIELSVHYTKPVDGAPPIVRFEVRDTGTGISKDALKGLFKGIGTGKDRRKANENNTGLGLVVCKKLVELMGGTIEVKSAEDKGSIFIVSLPITPSLKSISNHARVDSMHLLEGKRILLVDDNQAVLNSMEKQLKEWKIIPLIAGSGSQALDMADSQPFEAMITDINMSGMNGIELAKTIRSKHPKLPIIGMTINGDEPTKEAPSVFSTTITKPAKQMELLDKLLDLFAVETVQTSTTTTGIFADRFPLNILIAEDNPVNQKIAGKILTKLGYKPSLANHGKEVMEMVGQEHYDLILMDVQMPHMDGLEATRMIRTCLEKQPVIIALTANAMHGDRDECRQAGMDDYMSKPINLDELMRQLEKWSGGKQ